MHSSCWIMGVGSFEVLLLYSSNRIVSLNVRTFVLVRKYKNKTIHTCLRAHITPFFTKKNFTQERWQQWTNTRKDDNNGQTREGSSFCVRTHLTMRHTYKHLHALQSSKDGSKTRKERYGDRRCGTAIAMRRPSTLTHERSARAIWEVVYFPRIVWSSIGIATTSKTVVLVTCKRSTCTTSVTSVSACSVPITRSKSSGHHLIECDLNAICHDRAIVRACAVSNSTWICTRIPYAVLEVIVLFLL